MSLPFLSPDQTRIPTEQDLFALPFNWMTAACMASSFRRLTGWQGLAPVAAVARAFTCRIQSHPGVYGVLPLSAKPGEHGTAIFHLFYFPSPDDPLIDRVSLPAAIAASSTEAAQRIRNFPDHADFSSLFILAEMRLSLTHPGRELALALTAPVHSRIVSPGGIKDPDGNWLVKPGDYEEDIPAFDLARDLFRVLVAGLSAAQNLAPKKETAAESPATERIRDKDGNLTVHTPPDALMRTEMISWGDGATAQWPTMTVPVERAQYRLARVAAGVEAPDTQDAAKIRKPHLIVLSGFLGAGKTSFLNQFIEHHLSHDRLVGVIQNEIGETGVDANLLEGEDSVLALDDGCVCCSLAGSLTRGLRQLNTNLSPEYIVLETTGLANPMNMIDEFHEVSDLADLSAVISVVDASRFFDNLAASDVTEQQVRAADAIILNKCDLVDEATRGRIEAEIRKLNAQAKIIPAQNGRVNPSLLDQGLSRHAGAEGGQGFMCDCGADHHVHGVTHMDEGYSALRLPLLHRVDRASLLQTLKSCPPNVLRAKGVVRLADSDEPQIIQYVPGSADCEPAARDVTDSPFILIIGRDLDEAAIRTLWLPLTDKDAKE